MGRHNFNSPSPLQFNQHIIITKHMQMKIKKNKTKNIALKGKKTTLPSHCYQYNYCPSND